MTTARLEDSLALELSRDISSSGAKPSQRLEERLWFRGTVAAVGLLLLVQLAFCWSSHSRSLAGDADMRAFYAAGHIVAAGQGASLYRLDWQHQVQDGIFAGPAPMLPFLYPAFSALFFVPLSRMPYPLAFSVFWLLNGGVLALTAILLHTRLPGLRRLHPLLVVCGFACLFPVSIAWTQGQISFLLLLIYTLSYLLLEAQRPFLAGLVAALALAKFQTALPVALLFLCWRVHRFVAGVLCGAISLGAVSLAIAGWSGCLEYLSMLSRIGNATLLHASAAKQQYGMFAGDMPNLHGLFFALSHGSLAGQAASAICSLALILWVRSKAPSLPLALSAAMLVSYHLQPYDLLLLLLPAAVSLSLLLDLRTRRQSLWQTQAIVLSASLIFLIAPVAPLVLISRLSVLFVLPLLGVLWTVASLGRTDQARSPD